MNVKSLRALCTETVSASLAEKLPLFLTRLKHQTRKAIVAVCIGAVISIAAIILFISIVCGGIRMNLIKSLAPIYIMVVGIYAVVIGLKMVAMHRVYKTTQQALLNHTALIFASEIYKFVRRQTDQIRTADGNEISGYYKFRAASDRKKEICVGDRQHNCFFDEMKPEKEYRLYCIDEKYIFFVEE